MRNFAAVALTALGCLSCAALNHPPRASRPAAPPSAVLALAQMGIAAVTAVSPIWRGWRPGQAPFAIIGANDQWLFQSPKPPRGYDSAAYSSPLGPIYHAPSLTGADGERVRAPPTFFARASVNDADVVFLIMRPEAPLPGRTAPLTKPEWTEIFVHEYFHTFQMQDPTWAADLRLCEQARPLLDGRYTEPEFRQQVQAEVALEWALVSSAARTHRLDRAQLASLLTQRRERRARLGALAAAESALEKVEGSARYIDQSVFTQPAVLPILHEIDPDFTPWSLERSLQEGFAVSDHRYWYATGYGLVWLLEMFYPDWHGKLADHDLAELLAEAPG